MGSSLYELATQWWLQKLSSSCDKTDFTEQFPSTILKQRCRTPGVSHFRHQTQQCPVAGNAYWKQYPAWGPWLWYREKCYRVLEQKEPWWPSGDQLIMEVVGNQQCPFFDCLSMRAWFFVAGFLLQSPLYPLSLKLYEELSEEKVLKGRIFNSWGNQICTSLGLSQASLQHNCPPPRVKRGWNVLDRTFVKQQKIQGLLCRKVWVSI